MATSKNLKQRKHPSGLTWDRWNDFFNRTEQERRRIARWAKRTMREELFKGLGPGVF